MTLTLDMGWARLANGFLLQAAEDAGFELLLTTDKNMRYQQNLTNRKIALVVLGNQQWSVAQRYVREVVSAVDSAAAGSYFEVPIPFR